MHSSAVFYFFARVCSFWASKTVEGNFRASRSISWPEGLQPAMLALLGLFAGLAAAGEALVAGSEPLGGRKLSFLAGSDPSVASHLAAAVPLTSGGGGADSTTALTSTRCAGTRGSGGHGAVVPQPPCPRRVGPPPYPECEPVP